MRSVDWAGYEPFVPARPSARPQSARCSSGTGIAPADDDESIQSVNDWFRGHVEPDPSDGRRLRPLWYAVVNDLALWLGDVIVARNPSVEWRFFTHGHRIVAGRDVEPDAFLSWIGAAAERAGGG